MRGSEGELWKVGRDREEASDDREQLDAQTSSGWMDAVERADRGFAEDDVIVMPLPNFLDSSDDDG